MKRSRRKTRPVLFVHGGGGGAYAADAKLAADLEEKLGPGYVVRFPKLPNEADPDYQTWKRRILKELGRMGDDAILVGHSIGASVAIKLVTDGEFEHSLAGVFLISTPFWYDHDVWHWKEVELRGDAGARLPGRVPLFFYHGREDEVVPFSHLGMYAKAFPKAVIRRLGGRDHQLNDDLTEVARDISRLR
jgi:predicted alpha/beta hydrolase family esterase